MIVMMKAELGPPPVNPITGTAPPVPPGPADVQLAFRLKVQKKQITEVEHIYARITAASQLANLQKPRAAFFATVPPEQQSSRDIMLLIGNAYYDSLMQSDGDAAPFAEDCARCENGMHTAGVGAPPPQPGALPIQGCAEQLTSRAMSYIASIDLRRVWIADEEKGLVFGLTMFRHPMTEKFGDRGNGVHAPVILKERLEPVYQVGRVLPCGPAGNTAGSEEQDPAYDST
jgi:hypothetical protein